MTTRAWAANGNLAEHIAANTQPGGSGAVSIDIALSCGRRLGGIGF
jgi:hypothetical protein